MSVLSCLLSFSLLSLSLLSFSMVYCGAFNLIFSLFFKQKSSFLVSKYILRTYTYYISDIRTFCTNFYYDHFFGAVWILIVRIYVFLFLACGVPSHARAVFLCQICDGRRHVTRLREEYRIKIRNNIWEDSTTNKITLYTTPYV